MNDRSSPALPPSDTPAEALGDAWKLLDVLPRSSAPPSLTSTTLEMVAASADAAARPRGIPSPAAIQTSFIHWLLPAAAVIGSLILGIVLGRWTAPVQQRPAGLDRLERLEQLDRLERLERMDRQEQRREWLERRDRRRPFNAAPPFPGPPPDHDPRRLPPPPGEIPPPPR